MDMHRADRAYRRRNLCLLAAAVPVLALALAGLQAWLGDVVAAFPAMQPGQRREWLRWLLAALFIGLATPLALAARMFHRFASQVRMEERLPPVRWRTWRDVRVMRGPAALAWARRARRAGQLTAVGSALLAACAAVLWWRFG